MREWIDARDVPPSKLGDREISDDVLAYLVGGGGYFRMITVFYSYTDDEWYTDVGDDIEAGEVIKCWTQLPEPPK